MSPTPGQIVKLRMLSVVPVSEYSDLAPPCDPSNEKERLSFFKKLRRSKPSSDTKTKKSGPKMIEMNAACWLSFGNKIMRPVSLWLNVSDDKGERSYLVDEQSLKGYDKTMLSGSVRFKVYGDLKQVQACCGGLASEDLFRVDELYVKRNHDYIMLNGEESTRLAM